MTMHAWLSALETAAGGIIPLVLGMLFLQRFILRSSAGINLRMFIGLLLYVLGYVIFIKGLTTGLMPLGMQVGNRLLVVSTNATGHVSINGILIFFALLLGYGATIAEPALAAMGIEVEQVTSGACRRTWLIHTVGVGVAIGVTTGLVMTVLEWPLWHFILPVYGLLAVLGYMGSDRFNNIAWDSAGVTTGPITVPLVLALGLGLASAPLYQAFGILALASAGPILTVSIMGALIERAQSKGGVHGTTK